MMTSDAPKSLLESVFIYNAYVTSVYDGDTITCDIDCGFGVSLLKQKIRLLDIDTPEVRGDERERGLIARDALRDKIEGKNVTLRTLKDRKGKYGRYLATVFICEGADIVNVNEWLVNNGLAVYAEY